mmetsp:Transcript_678/g.1491  ORF Transcript_678/g.1491 Transcript_678/m.1491 type:complete len:431 (+) Transcript_678:1549-2841(+)
MCLVEDNASPNSFVQRRPGQIDVCSILIIRISGRWWRGRRNRLCARLELCRRLALLGLRRRSRCRPKSQAMPLRTLFVQELYVAVITLRKLDDFSRPLAVQGGAPSHARCIVAASPCVSASIPVSGHRHGRRSAAGAGVSARRICVRTGPLTAATLGRGGRCLCLRRAFTCATQSCLGFIRKHGHRERHCTRALGSATQCLRGRTADRIERIQDDVRLSPADLHFLDRLILEVGLPLRLHLLLGPLRVRSTEVLLVVEELLLLKEPTAPLALDLRPIHLLTIVALQRLVGGENDSPPQVHRLVHQIIQHTLLVQPIIKTHFQATWRCEAKDLVAPLKHCRSGAHNKCGAFDLTCQYQRNGLERFPHTHLICQDPSSSGFVSLALQHPSETFGLKRQHRAREGSRGRMLRQPARRLLCWRRFRLWLLPRLH